MFLHGYTPPPPPILESPTPVHTVVVWKNDDVSFTFTKSDDPLVDPRLKVSSVSIEQRLKDGILQPGVSSVSTSQFLAPSIDDIIKVDDLIGQIDEQASREAAYAKILSDNQSQTTNQQTTD